jgi:hypothetical protein
MEMPNLPAFARLAWVRQANWNHLLLAKDLKLIQLKDYQDLARRTSEVKRMLTGLFRKLKADR